MTIRPDLGQPMPALVEKARRAIELEAESQRRQVDHAFKNSKRPSAFSSDGAAWRSGPRIRQEARRQLAYLGQDASRLLHASNYDHLVSIGRLLGGDGAVSLYAHTTLSRSACEAAVRLEWLIEPDVTPAKRLLRAAAEAYDGQLAKLKGAKELPETGHSLTQQRTQIIGACEESVQRVVDVLDAAAIVRVLDRSGKKVARLELEGESVPMKFETGPRMAKVMAEFPAWYTTSSAFAHSLTWTLGDSRRDEFSSDLVLELNVIEAGAAAAAAIHSSELLIGTYARYFGVDPEPLMKPSRQRWKMVDTYMAEYAHGREMRVIPGPL